MASTKSSLEGARTLTLRVTGISGASVLDLLGNHKGTLFVLLDGLLGVRFNSAVI